VNELIDGFRDRLELSEIGVRADVVHFPSVGKSGNNSDGGEKPLRPWPRPLLLPDCLERLSAELLQGHWTLCSLIASRALLLITTGSKPQPNGLFCLRIVSKEQLKSHSNLSIPFQSSLKSIPFQELADFNS
jgi:hypothetical protein